MSLRKNKKGTRDNLIYNTRQWEKRNGVYYIQNKYSNF